MDWVRKNALPLGLLAAYVATWSYLAIDPLSRSDWVLENLLVGLTIPLLVAFHGRLGITKASDVMLFLFYTLHAIGGHWSYSNVPFIPWEEWGFERNHFDRIVHFSFGLLLWLPLRDALVRFARVGRAWSGVFALSIIWALSGAYEVIEWGAVGVVSPELGQEFLGAQGDEFDASKDMALAMSGALLAFTTERVLAVLRRTTQPVRATVRSNAQPAIAPRGGQVVSGVAEPSVAGKKPSEPPRDVVRHGAEGWRPPSP